MLALRRYGKETDHDARLAGFRIGSFLSADAVCHRHLWRPVGASASQADSRPSDHLFAQPGDLLHLLDLLRRCRPGCLARARIHRDLYRPDPDVHAGDANPQTHRHPGQGRKAYLDCRLHGCALRQEPAGGSPGRTDRRDRHDPLHRAAAQGGVLIGRGDGRCRAVEPGDGNLLPVRHFLLRDAGACGFRGHLRHPAYRCDRTPGWPDPGHCDGISGQAAGVLADRTDGDVRDVRRPLGPVAGRHLECRGDDGNDA